MAKNLVSRRWKLSCDIEGPYRRYFKGKMYCSSFFMLLFYCTLSEYYLLVLYEVQIQKISRTMSSHLQVDQTNLIKQIFTYCQNVTIFCSRSNMGHALQDIGPSSLLLIPARTEFLSSFLLTQPEI